MPLLLLFICALDQGSPGCNVRESPGGLVDVQILTQQICGGDQALHFFFLFYFSTTVDIQYYFMLVLGVHQGLHF